MAEFIELTWGGSTRLSLRINAITCVNETRTGKTEVFVSGDPFIVDQSYEEILEIMEAE